MEDDKKRSFEGTNAERLFQFISGSGTASESFENQITALPEGDKFDFTTPADEVYGAYDGQHIFDLPKNILEIDGKFDSERVTEGSIILLMTGDGRRVNASVIEVKPDVVVVDLNHPLTGASLISGGEVIEDRPTTNEEIQKPVKMMSSEDCGCGCDSYDSDCDDDCGCEGRYCH